MATLDMFEAQPIPELPIESESKPKPKPRKKKTVKKPKPEKKEITNVQYIAATDFWDSNLCKYYKRGDVIVLPEDATPPPHCKKI